MEYKISLHTHGNYESMVYDWEHLDQEIRSNRGDIRKVIINASKRIDGIVHTQKIIYRGHMKREEFVKN